MRVISGSAGGLALNAPPDGVRPTMDRVKGAIFSSLGDAVPDAVVLELFAGSGAMGIEALSRGAARCVFVDSDERCAACVRSNLRKTGVDGVVQRMDAYRFLDAYAEEESYDLIFADPPYSKKPGDPDHSALIVQSDGLMRALRPGGMLVLERHAGAGALETSLALMKSRRYGDSEVLYFSRQ